MQPLHFLLSCVRKPAEFCEPGGFFRGRGEMGARTQKRHERAHLSLQLQSDANLVAASVEVLAINERGQCQSNTCK